VQLEHDPRCNSGTCWPPAAGYCGQLATHCLPLRSCGLLLVSATRCSRVRL